MEKNKKTALASVFVLAAIAVGFFVLNIELNTKSDFSDYETTYPQDLPGYSDTDFRDTGRDAYKPTPQPVIAEDTASYAHFYSQEQEGVEWLEHPELVGPLNVFSDNTWGRLNERLFYRIGYDNGNDILVTQVPCDGICNAQTVFFVEKAGTYHLLTNHSDYEGIPLTTGERPQDVVARGVGIDTKTQYVSLSYPDELIVNGEYFQNQDRFGGGMFFFANVKDRLSENTELQLEAVTEYGPLYSFGESIRDIADRDRYTNSRLTRYYLRLQGGLSVIYRPDFQFVGDDGVPQIAWIDGTQNTRPYKTNSVGGCGSSGTEVVQGEDILAGDIEIIGYAIGENPIPIYGLTRTNHFLIEKLFNASNGRYYVYNHEAKRGEYRAFTELDILNDHLLFLYKNAFGDYVVFSSTQHAPAAECAKPVIYLYPEEVTKVSVEVGAHVTKSEPLYGDDGWTVVAHPNGVLEYGNVKYDSLFWDGIGYGEYPFPEAGFVVKSDEVERTLNNHLDAFGLNIKEKEDFLEFWLTHIPDTPYVRLSWITTEEMDQLAPLAVTPRPDTVLRIFLDFEGLDAPIDIEPQEIVPVTRDGFTLIEWGGLLVK